MGEASTARKSTMALRVLNLAKILQEKTDESHGLTRQDLTNSLLEIGLIEDTENYQETYRKTFASDIKCLEQFFGDSLLSGQGRNATYRLLDHDFQAVEIELLADAVQASMFLTQKKADELIGKIKKLGGLYSDSAERKNLHVMGRIKSDDDYIYYRLDAIGRAIEKGCKLQFEYLKYNESKERIADAEPRVVTPMHLVYMDANYYMVAWAERSDGTEGITNFRVDRMWVTELLEDEPGESNEQIDAFDVNKYEERVFGMFGQMDAHELVHLRVAGKLMNAVVDRFGADVQVTEVEDGYARLTVDVIPSDPFYGWLATLGTSVRVEGPISVREGYLQHLRDVMAVYE